MMGGRHDPLWQHPPLFLSFFSACTLAVCVSLRCCRRVRVFRVLLTVSLPLPEVCHGVLGSCSCMSPHSAARRSGARPAGIALRAKQAHTYGPVRSRGECCSAPRAAAAAGPDGRQGERPGRRTGRCIQGRRAGKHASRRCATTRRSARPDSQAVRCAAAPLRPPRRQEVWRRLDKNELCALLN